MSLKVVSKYIEFSTQGMSEVIDITADIKRFLKGTGIKEGIVNISCLGSTAGLTTLEYEPALVKDLQSLLDKVIPAKVNYRHNSTWADANGHSHLRSSLIGTSLTFPITAGRLELGTWQQVVFIDFDNRPRQRKVALKFLGE